MDRLVWCVADGTHRVGFGSLLGAALKALSLATNVHRRLHACKAGGPHITYVTNVYTPAYSRFLWCSWVLIQTTVE